MPRTRATVCKWRASMATRTVPRLSAHVISVIVPTYNEAGSLPPLVDRLATAMAGHTWELVIVDDGSPDGTADVAARLSATHPVWVVRRPGKAGLASAVIAGFNESRGDILVVMDADLSHPPETVPALVKAIEDGADLAVGSRYIKGGATMDWPLRRRVVSRVACLIGNVLVPVRDATSGFFALRRTAIDGVHLNAIGFKIGFEVIARAKTKKIVEVPYTFRDRELGASKFRSEEHTSELQSRLHLVCRLLLEQKIRIVIHLDLSVTHVIKNQHGRERLQSYRKVTLIDGVSTNTQSELQFFLLSKIHPVFSFSN